MTWQSIRGHDEIAERFRRMIVAGRLASTFLFVGIPGIGKRAFALKLAQGLLCETHTEEEFNPCGRCPACVQVIAGSHPDVFAVNKPADRNELSIKLFIGSDEDNNRNRAGLCYDISLKPVSGRRKIGIINDADYLNGPSTSCLLKTLEEPPPKSILILIATSEQRQFPTIRSRCQIVRFKSLSRSDVKDLLLSTGVCNDAATAAVAAQLGRGSMEQAIKWCDEAYLEFRVALYDALAQRDFDSRPLAKMFASFVESAGKEGAEKRARMRDIASMGADFYRLLMLALSGEVSADEACDELLIRTVGKAQQWWPGDGETASACLEICLDLEDHVDAYANATLLSEWWLDSLAETARNGRRIDV